MAEVIDAGIVTDRRQKSRRYAKKTGETAGLIELKNEFVRRRVSV
jgi:hypothetical protein